MTWGMANDGDGSTKVILTEPRGSSAEVLLQGGQLISWKISRREELLFRSSKDSVKPNKARRGGIPISFPQFGNYGSLEPHGFARTRLWALDSCPAPLPPPKNNSSVDLILKSMEDDLKIWPHSFELRLRVTISHKKLTLIPRVRNTDSKPFSFTFSLSNYLAVSDIRFSLLTILLSVIINHSVVVLVPYMGRSCIIQFHCSEVRVEGLETLDYFDNLKQKARTTEQTDAITFDGEIDRVYLGSPAKIAVIDHEKKRTLVLRKEGFPDAGLWNPWEKKARAMPDMGDDDHESMLCLDSAAVETPIHLKPSEEWMGRQELLVVSSSYCSGQLDPRKVLYG